MKPLDKKLADLKAYRRARGLCDHCGEKWSRDHKCAAKVGLNVLDELYALFSDDATEERSTPEDEEAGTDAQCCCLAGLSSAGSPGQTLQFRGILQQRPVLIMLDSGSSSSFISSQLVSQLSIAPSQCAPFSVRVANGAVMQCSTVVSGAVWSIHQYQFVHDLKVLPLPQYDIILGMDWLQLFSPMKVDWKNQWLSIPYRGKNVRLHGVSASSEEGPSQYVLQVVSMTSSDTEHFADISPQISQLLEEFPDITKPPVSLPPKRYCDHEIPLVEGARPVSVRPYRYPPALKDEIEAQVGAMLQQGIIQHSTSPFNSPVLLVRKKDGTWRFCVDYRYLNNLTVKTAFPIPVFEQLMDELAGARYFSTLDLLSGYHQIRLREGEEYKTAFSTHVGHYEFRVVAFGLTGAPGTFQGAMNMTLHPLLRRCVIVFFDDILVYSKTWEEHLQHLRQVFQLLARDQWHIKLSKCKFGQTSIAYLGHVISENGVATDPAKIAAVVSWPTPSNIKELRSFLGFAGFYRRFVQHFAIIAKPLTALLKKHSLFQWTSIHDTAFMTLKNALCAAPILKLPDFTRQFCIETDASNNGVGAVLLQDGHPLAFLSRALGPKNQGLSAYEKEYMAILIAIEQWRSYLQLGEFLIFTDQRSLVHLSDQRLHTTWQQKVFTKLLGLQYRIVYKPGNENRVADALSRRGHESELHAISAPVPLWLEEIKDSYATDSKCQSLLSKLTVSPDADPHFKLQQGLLRYKGRIWVGPNAVLQHKIIEALHDSPVGGHSGIPASYHRIKGLFAWPGLKHVVQRFVQSCPTCQQAKPDRAKYPGLLQPLPVPSMAWQSISMDFVEGLPSSGGKNCILVVVDRFSKYSHFIALAHPFTTFQVAKLFINNVYRLHGLPSSIVSDRDRVFTSQFWQELFRLAGVSLKMSSAYHPQTDGQTERVNQCLETFLRCFVSSIPTKWTDWIYLAEYWYNTSWHSSLGYSPFFVLYGHNPRHFGISEKEAVHSLSLDEWLKEKSLMNTLVQQHLTRAQKRMKSQADKFRSERQFAVGDWVYLKLQPYVQSSLAPRANQKLAFKFFGPFQVVSRVGSVAYKLLLPASSSIHPVFHVSQLKTALPADYTVSPLPPDLEGLQIPEKVLQRRIRTSDNTVVPQVLIQWSNLPRSLASWEDLDALKQRFPRAPAWGQASSLRGESVSNDGEPGVPEEETSTTRPRQSGRTKRPNVLISGPEWA
jgi:hypothetical protein